MKRYTYSMLIALAASALYINSSTSAQAGVIFSDIDPSYAKDAILRLADSGLFQGDGYEEFNPNESVSRQDFVIMIVNALNLSTGNPPERATFKDVSNDHYAFSAIEAAVNKGLVMGVGNGRFGLGQPLTQQDMAVLCQRALQEITGKEILHEGTLQEKSNDPSISEYAKDATALALELGLFPETANGFSPKGTVTREAAAAATFKWLQAAEQIKLDAPESELDTPEEELDSQPEKEQETQSEDTLPIIYGVATPSREAAEVPSGGAQPHSPQSGTESQGPLQSQLPTTPPSAPNDVKFHDVNGQVQLTWTQRQGETYNVYSSAQPGAGYTLLADGANVEAGSYVILNATHQEPTFYVIEAVNRIGKSGYSSEVSSRPNKVSGLQAILNEEEESISLTWSDAQEGVKYNVYYIGPDGSRSRLNDDLLDNRAYIISNLNMLAGPSGRYTLYVVAVNGLNVSSEPSNEVALDVKKDPEDRITITDPSVALPNDDLEEETTAEPESVTEDDGGHHLDPADVPLESSKQPQPDYIP
ncbi:S-layer homology domain-containing protein [Paenibacillus glucanolyticus]|uniref:S-layer homology domain-containing protein n=1 Tax=Paenibacillus glucanolyticus TaxID=59843 RepID=UPI0030C99735